MYIGSLSMTERVLGPIINFSPTSFTDTIFPLLDDRLSSCVLIILCAWNTIGLEAVLKHPDNQWFRIIYFKYGREFVVSDAMGRFTYSKSMYGIDVIASNL